MRIKVPRTPLVPAAVAIVIGQLGPGWPGAGDGWASAGIAPKAVNELDCNGWSPTYKSVRPALRGLCTGPVLRRAGKKAARFIDNGWP